MISDMKCRLLMYPVRLGGRMHAPGVAEVDAPLPDGDRMRLVRYWCVCGWRSEAWEAFNPHAGVGQWKHHVRWGERRKRPSRIERKRLRKIGVIKPQPHKITARRKYLSFRPVSFNCACGWSGSSQRAAEQHLESAHERGEDMAYE